MQTEIDPCIDLNKSEIDLNECEHILKANLDWSENRSIQDLGAIGSSDSFRL